jgi:hypothetical protein
MAMGKRIGQIGCFLLLLGLGGCKGIFGPQGLPADPLFANRQPIESKANAGPPMAMPDREPTPPMQTFGVAK